MAKINTVFGMTDGVSTPLKNIVNNLNKSIKGFESLSGTIVTVNSAIQLFSTVANKVKDVLSKPIQDASEYESLLVRLTVATGDAVTAQEEFQKLKDFAKTSPFDLPGVVQASIMFRNAGVEAEKLIPTIQMLGDVAQGNNDYFNRMAINFMQIKSAGKATMQDLNQFAYMGVPIKQVLKDMGVTGVATADDIERAFKIMTSAGGQFYNSMSSNANTTAGLSSNMRDAIQQFSAEIGTIFLPVVRSAMSYITQLFTVMTEKLQQLKSNFSNFVNNIKSNIENFKQSIADNISTVVLSLGLLATGITTIGIIWIATHAKMLATTILTVGKSIGLWIVNITKMVAIHAVQMAKMAVQWVIGLGPVGWIIMGIIALIAGAIAICIKMGTTFEDVGRVIGKAFGAIKAFGQNAFIAIWNVVAKVWDKIAEFLNWMGIDSVARMEVKEFVNVKDEMEKYGQKGSQIGKGVDDWLKGFVGDMQNKANGIMNPPESVIGDNFKYDSSGALIVSDKEKINLADDFRELLSKQATERFNLQFSSVTPSVNVGDIIVNNNADYEKIIDEIVTGAETAQSSSLRS